ncbi:MAG TPA: hypothetical protein VIT92_11765 [Burkholderiaceae bacterium]
MLLLGACTTLLPNSTTETKTPWNSYADAEAMFSKIVPNQTTIAQLRELGVDPFKTPNVALLSNADLLRRLVANASIDVSSLDPAVQQCLTRRVDCVGYEIEQTMMSKKRVGNFFADFLTFRQETDITGWQFKAIVAVQDGVVIYKLWSGKPRIQEYERSVRPLGPLQNLGSRINY